MTRTNRAGGIDPICPTPTWARIARFIVANHPRRGRPCPPERWREYLDAIPYVLRTGCAWRHLPHDFAVKRSSAHKHFLRWCEITLDAHEGFLSLSQPALLLRRLDRTQLFYTL